MRNRHVSTDERLKEVLRIIERNQNIDGGAGTAIIIGEASAAELYGAMRSESCNKTKKRREANSLRKAVLRDVKRLIDDGRIKRGRDRGVAHTYKIVTDTDPEERVQEYWREVMLRLGEGALSQGDLETIREEIRARQASRLPGDDKLRIVSPSVRLVPAAVKPAVMIAVLEALSFSKTLKVTYQNAQGGRSDPVLHPQALIQRGPVIYLHALKNEDTSPVRAYLLHRMIKAEVRKSDARTADGFNLDAAAADGTLDFAQQVGTLELLVRGRVHTLLRDCPLCESQVIQDEPEGAPFEARVTAKMPLSGELFKWILGCGRHVEVVSPADIRASVASELAMATAIYE